MNAENLNDKRIRKVLLLGSGGLSIGQAGEFDYSGCQAMKSLEEEGVEVIVVNPNIATVQTTPTEGRKIYLYPVEPEWVEKIIREERPDGIMAGFGGQTALNCVIKLDEMGVLQKYQVLNLGTATEVLRLTEDRDLFAQKMLENGIPVPPSSAATTVDEALQAAARIGYPVIVRAAFALGGLGSGFAHNAEELRALVSTTLTTAPQVLIEKSLQGWKEVEYEVMRDSYGNAMTICNMENFDPLGIHTGDSIVVAPSQTLTDQEYQLLRSTSLKIVQLLKIVGECNVQFALNPQSLEYYVIEINARLSRSSALASKATGYPIAFIAAKVVLGKSLLQIKLPMASHASAYFEPAMDYIVVKIPRWDLGKFKGVSRRIGTTMKSIGEVMGIGRTFPEALQKAIRMVTENECGFWRDQGLDPSVQERQQEIKEALKAATDTRLMVVMEAIRLGISLGEIHQKTHIDPWFLFQLSEIQNCEKDIMQFGQDLKEQLLPSTFNGHEEQFLAFFQASLVNLSSARLRVWKIMGFSDEHIARLCLMPASTQTGQLSAKSLFQSGLLVRKWRKNVGVIPVIKKIDTSAAEFPTESNYLYLTYGGKVNDDIPLHSQGPSALVLGGGSYRIGSSVEFDWCAVSCMQRLKKAGWSCSAINFNPETVSTDYHISDRLYFEELSLERILDILEFENPTGVVVSMSGQLPNKMAQKLQQLQVPLLGHPWAGIDGAEDREKFSALLDQCQILQPRWVEAKTAEAIEQFIQEVGFPVLVRPSYVLSGAAMNVAVDRASLQHCLSLAKNVSPEHPVIISQYYENSQEVELDAVAQKGEVLISMISEHVENAGVHSGDATLIFPPQHLSGDLQWEIRGIGQKIARALQLNGPFNIQFLIKDQQVLVIECNVRASRSFPFVSKVAGVNMIDLATEVMMEEVTGHQSISSPSSPVQVLWESKVQGIGVKSAMFSFHRLNGADPVLGVEMTSTGEVACLGQNLQEAILLSFQASGIKVPRKGVLLSAGPLREKDKLLPAVQILQQMGIPIYATTGTAQHFQKYGYFLQEVEWGDIIRDVTELIHKGQIDFVINIPKNLTPSELSIGRQIRLLAVQNGCTLMTNVEKVNAFLQAVMVANASLGELPLLAL